MVVVNEEVQEKRMQEKRIQEESIQEESIQERIGIYNLRTLAEIEAMRSELRYPVLVTHQKFPPKKAGVGLARKVGMDEAAWFFNSMDKDGIIVCFDADCTCSPNYLQQVCEFYRSDHECGVVNYEHKFEEHKWPIIYYELHLRYYVNALRWAGFPYAYQTLGSCITVKSRRYQKEGGMNTRKAGEDFYFLHKVIPNGKFGEINGTAIHPSDRVSDRVPFGTGHAIDKYLKQEQYDYWTYNPKTFEDLHDFLDQIDHLFDSNDFEPPSSMKNFLAETTFSSDLEKIRSHSPDLKIFRKRFFHWMDAFRILKYVHFCRDHFYPNVQLTDALNWLNLNFLEGANPVNDLENYLINLRHHDRLIKFPTESTNEP